MKKLLLGVLVANSLILTIGCNNETAQTTDSTAAVPTEEHLAAGQSGVQDDVSQKNVVQVAVNILAYYRRTGKIF